MRALPYRTPSRQAPVARLADDALPSSAGAQSWPGRTVEVDGQRVHVRHTPPTGPDAEPALLVHGLGGSATNWTEFAALTRGRMDSEAIDLPGFGRSGPARDGDYSIEAHARTVIGYLDGSQRGPVHLVSNSMGGAISILVAARRPDLVRTLTLIAPAVSDLKVRLHPLRSDWRLGLVIVPVLGAIAMRRMGATPVETRVKGTIALCVAHPERVPRERYDEMLTEARAHAEDPWIDQALLRSTRGLVRSQFLHGRAGWTTMRSLQPPTLVVWGDKDKLVAPDLAPFVAAAIPQSRLLELGDVGHVPMIEDPVTTARAQLALVADCTGRALPERRSSCGNLSA